VDDPIPVKGGDDWGSVVVCQLAQACIVPTQNIEMKTMLYAVPLNKLYHEVNGVLGIECMVSSVELSKTK
jgi:hypothetical protein